MASLTFVYAPMNAGKSANLLSVAHNYKERGMKALILKPSIDTRNSSHEVVSRLGISAECSLIDSTMDIVEYFKYKSIESRVDCVLVDEAQFLSKDNILGLSKIVDEFNVPVMCFGLRTNFKGELFEGSKWLFSYADKIQELKTVCHCGRKSIMTAKMDSNGLPITEGDEVCIGDSEYTTMCRKHYFEFIGQ